MLNPMKHQVKAMQFIDDKKSFALTMDMGTGKSLIICMQSQKLYNENIIDKVLIISPNYLKSQWITEHYTEHFGANNFESFIYNGALSSLKEKSEFNRFVTSDKLKVMCVNIEAFQTKNIDDLLLIFLNKKLSEKDVFIVIDESVIIKNPKAIRTTKILKGFKNHVYKAILSGTPTPQSPVDLWSQYEFLKPNYFGCSYFQFQHRHVILMTHKLSSGAHYNSPISQQEFDSIKNALKKLDVITAEALLELAHKYNISEANLIKINKMESFTPFKDMDKLNEQISHITFKVMKKDCLDLPDKIYEKIIIELNPEQKRLYKELTKDFITNYNNRDLSVSNTISLLSRLRMITGGIFPYYDIDYSGIEDIEQLMERQNSKSDYKKIMRITNNPKINAIIEDLQSVDNETSIIIWSNYIECIKYIYDELSKLYNCAVYYGAVNESDRKQIILDFQAKKIKILIMNPMTGGMGLNLQVCTLQYFYDNSYQSDYRVQAEDRSHRAGQVNKVVYKDVIANNTLDAKIIDVLNKKIDILNYFKDSNNLRELLK